MLKAGPSIGSNRLKDPEPGKIESILKKNIEEISDNEKYLLKKVLPDRFLKLRTYHDL